MGELQNEEVDYEIEKPTKETIADFKKEFKENGEGFDEVNIDEFLDQTEAFQKGMSIDSSDLQEDEIESLEERLSELSGEEIENMINSGTSDSQEEESLEIDEAKTAMQELEIALHGTTLADLEESVETDEYAALPESLESDVDMSMDSDLIESQAKILTEKYGKMFGNNKLDRVEANKLLTDIRRWTNRNMVDTKYFDNETMTDKFQYEDNQRDYTNPSDNTSLEEVEKAEEKRAWMDSYSESTPDFSDVEEHDDFLLAKEAKRAK